MLDKYPQPAGAQENIQGTQSLPCTIDTGSAKEVLKLSRLDQTILRVYVRQLLIFPVSKTSLREDAGAVLAAGLLATLKQFPFLAGTVEQTNSATGALTVQYPKEISSELVSRILTVNIIDRSGLDYEALCEAGIPPVRLPADVLCPFAMRCHPGIDDAYAEILTTFAKEQPIPVFAAQLNFIPGGLILSAYTHHSVVDGTGISKIYQVWSGHTKAYGGGIRLPEQTNAAVLNDARNVLDSLEADAETRKLPEFRYPDDPVNPPLRDTPFKLSARLLVFAAATIAQLATELSAVTTERISSFTALTALIWCQATNARRAVIVEKGIQEITLGIATDHRKRIGSLLPDDYLGNVANGMTVSVPLSAIPNAESMDATHIAPVALALSNALKEVDLNWFRARLLEMSKQKNSTKLMLNCDTMNGPDIFVTSWMHIGADDVWAIPGTVRTEDDKEWACKPTAIRKPHNLWEGGMQILPRRKGDEAPYEIPLCLEEGDMERVLRSLEEANWVERVIEA